jgi:hypothetical protein
MSNQLEPKNDDYKGPVAYCAICDKALELDNIHEEFRYVDGLGDLCLVCYLKEMEISNATA